MLTSSPCCRRLAHNIICKHTLRLVQFICEGGLRLTNRTLHPSSPVDLLVQRVRFVVRKNSFCHMYFISHNNNNRWFFDRLSGLVVSVPGYRSRDTGLDSRRYQIFWELVGLERGPLSLVSITEELLEWKSNGSGSRKPRLTALGIVALTTRHPLSAAAVARYSSLANYSHGV
jgi:hypothetical protein